MVLLPGASPSAPVPVAAGPARDGPQPPCVAYCCAATAAGARTVGFAHTWLPDPASVVRYIGNKTRLLSFIRRVLRSRGIGPGRALDPFSGTASVARALKRWQFHTSASDIMEYGYIFARAYVEVVTAPVLSGIADEIGGTDLRHAFTFLNRLKAAPSFIHEHYSPHGAVGASHGRMYFTPENAAYTPVVLATRSAASMSAASRT